MGGMRRNIFLGTGGSVLLIVICVGLTWTLSSAAPTASETTVLVNSTAEVQDVGKINGLASESSSAAPVATSETPSTTTPLSSNGRRRFILRGNKSYSTSSTQAPVYRGRKRQANIVDPHYQPLDVSLPKDAVIPFLEFGQKLLVASSSINSIAELKAPTTLTPVKNGPTRLTIHVEKSTSPNSITSTQHVEPTSSTSTTTSTTTVSSIENTPGEASLSSSTTESSVEEVAVTTLALSTNAVSKHAFSAKISSSKPTEVPTTSTTVAPAVTTEKTVISHSISDESYNDIMSIRRRRKKLVARRMQFNNTASEVVTDAGVANNGTVMNAALVRRKTLLQPQRNSTAPQSIARRPLIRMTMPPLPKYTVDTNTTQTAENQTEVIRNLLSSYHPSATNYTTSTRAITLEGLGNGTTWLQNFTLSEYAPSTASFGQAVINRTETPLESAESSPMASSSVKPPVPVSTTSSTTTTSTTTSSTTTSTTTTTTTSTTASPTTSKTTPEVPPSVIKIESTTRRAWRPSFTSTRRPMPSSPEGPSTSSTRTSTMTRPTSSTARPSTPIYVDMRPMASETTFSSSRPAVTEYTVKPLLGSSANRPQGDDDARGSSLSLVTYALLSLAFVTAIGVASYGARHWANRRRRMLDESDSSCSEASSMAGATLKRPVPNSDEVGILPRIHHNWPSEKNSVQSPPQLPEWHFPRSKLRLQTVLGQGNFGQVWKAEAEDICGIPGTRLVAVKSTKSNAGEREKSDLLRELAIMQQLGAHPNVVTLLGCCTEQEPHLLIMEYVMYGKLLTFLRDHRTRRDILHFSSSDDDGGEQALNSWDLTHFAYCIAKGMEYLVSRGIIHRDLAARNILVDHNKQCKIADFGMSRHARDSSGQVYEPKQKGALPIRWMAPESLVKSVFTHRSDVWSFGITMWEIVTLGSTPYSTMGAREVMRRVREGYRLERPQHCRPELFRVVGSCWLGEPYHRPDFAQLRQELRRLRDEGADCPGGGHVDLQSAIPPPSPASTLPPNSAGPHSSDHAAI